MRRGKWIIVVSLLLAGCSKGVTEAPRDSTRTISEIREHASREKRVDIYTRFLEENKVDHSGLPFDILQLEVYKLLPKPNTGNIQDLTDIYNVYVYEEGILEGHLVASYLGVMEDDPNLPPEIEIKLGMSEDGNILIENGNTRLFESRLADWEHSYLATRGEKYEY